MLEVAPSLLIHHTKTLALTELDNVSHIEPNVNAPCTEKYGQEAKPCNNAILKCLSTG